MLGSLMSLITGSGTGIIGSMISNFTDYLEQGRKNKHELKLREMDLREMDKEYEAREKIAATKTDSKTQQVSYEHDARSYSKDLKIQSMWIKILLVIVDVIRALVRPALTAFLIYLVWDTRQEVQMIIDQTGMDALSPAKAISIYSTIIDMILFLTSTAVTWWFGTRPRKSKKQD